MRNRVIKIESIKNVKGTEDLIILRIVRSVSILKFVLFTNLVLKFNTTPLKCV